MRKLFFLTIVMAIYTTGCGTLTAPKYNTNFDNIREVRKERLSPVVIGEVKNDPETQEENESLTLRGTRFRSPYGDFAQYLAEALRQELDDARLLDPTSNIVISAVLSKNSLNAAGVSTGTAEIVARFFVHNKGDLRYNKVKSALHTWDSAFGGQIAIPRGQQNYPVAVQQLLGNLFSDPEFIEAIR